MNKRVIILVLVVAFLSLALVYALLSPKATPDVSAQGLCEYGPLFCDASSGWTFLTYIQIGFSSPRARGDCLQFGLDQSAEQAQVFLIIPDTTAKVIAGEGGDVSNIIGLTTTGPINICGDVMHFLGPITELVMP